MLETILPYVLNGAGGAIIGPILSKILGGKGSTGLIAGLVGGIAGGQGLEQVAQTGFQALLGGEGIMPYLSSFLNGGAGGGILGGVLGLVMKAK